MLFEATAPPRVLETYQVKTPDDWRKMLISLEWHYYRASLKGETLAVQVNSPRGGGYAPNDVQRRT